MNIEISVSKFKICGQIKKPVKGPVRYFQWYTIVVA